jgi:hypothetical protein
MATSALGQDVAMTENLTPPALLAEEPKYGGFTRFEIELEVRTKNKFHYFTQALFSSIVILSLQLFPSNDLHSSSNL